MTTTDDAFLNGRLHIRQPKDGYRAGADPVFLAAAVAAKAGDSVLELGCGAGVAILCLLSRVGNISVTGVDREAPALALARENLTRNNLDADIVQADITALPEELRSRSFDHVMTNPPFFDRAHGSPAENPAREAGRGAETALSDWIDVAIRRLAPKGTLTMIHRAEHLPACLAALDNRVGAITAKPLVPRQGKPAKLILLQAIKGAKAPFQLSAPLVLHTGDAHEKDGDSYTKAAKDILRNGAALSLKT